MKAKTPANTQTIAVRAEPIELCQLLKFAGLADTGGAAKAMINAGQVSLNGTVELQKRKKVMAGDRVSVDGQTLVVALG